MRACGPLNARRVEPTERDQIMDGLHRVVRAALLAAAGAVLVMAAEQLREKHRAVSATVSDIEDQVAALDPVTRAAVLTRLGLDSAKAVHERIGE